MTEKSNARIAFRVAETIGNEATPAPPSDIVSIREFLAEQGPDERDSSLLGDGVIAEQSVSVLAGDPGTGKTTLALNGGLCLSAGIDFLKINVPRPRRVLFLEAEGSRDAFRTRVAAAAAALGIDPCDLPLFFAAKDASFDIEDGRLLRAIEKCRAELTVFDTVTYFATLEENSASDWKNRVFKPLVDLAQGTGSAFLGLHHFGKPSDNRQGVHRIRGSGTIWGDADTIMTLDPAKTGKDHRILTFEKVRNGPPHASLVLRFDEPQALFTVTGESAVTAANPRLSKVQDFVREAVGGSISRGTLIDRLKAEFKVGETVGDDLVREAFRAGLIIKWSHGVYAMPGTEPPFDDPQSWGVGISRISRPLRRGPGFPGHHPPLPVRDSAGLPGLPGRSCAVD